MSSSTGLPWSSSSGSQTHPHRRHKHRKGGKGDEDDEEDDEMEEEEGRPDPEARKGGWLAPREYSIWTLDTTTMKVSDVTGDLPLRVEAWNSPFFQMTSIIAVKLKVRG
jgi:hypothetical protein